QPLLRDGAPVGSLSVLGKVAEDPLLGERFGPADDAVLERLAQHVAAALAAFREPARPDVDADTGPPTAAPLRARLEEELARSRLRGHRLAYLELRLEGFPGREPEGAGSAAVVARALRSGLRPGDVLGRPADVRFVAIQPEPDEEPP